MHFLLTHTWPLKRSDLRQHFLSSPYTQYKNEQNLAVLGSTVGIDLHFSVTKNERLYYIFFVLDYFQFLLDIAFQNFNENIESQFAHRSLGTSYTLNIWVYVNSKIK